MADQREDLWDAGKQRREIQDEDIKVMIEFWRVLEVPRIPINNTIAMLEELLKLRECVRKDA
jgi:hypothetical protein